MGETAWAGVCCPCLCHLGSLFIRALSFGPAGGGLSRAFTNESYWSGSRTIAAFPCMALDGEGQEGHPFEGVWTAVHGPAGAL